MKRTASIAWCRLSSASPEAHLQQQIAWCRLASTRRTCSTTQQPIECFVLGGFFLWGARKGRTDVARSVGSALGLRQCALVSARIGGGDRTGSCEPIPAVLPAGVILPKRRERESRSGRECRNTRCRRLERDQAARSRSTMDRSSWVRKSMVPTGDCSCTSVRPRMASAS